MPLDLFASRNFSIVNLSTFVIYGALYVSFVFQALFFQGTRINAIDYLLYRRNP